MNTFFCCYDSKKLIYLSGEFSSTILSSYVKTGTGYPTAISADEDNTIWLSPSYTKMWKQSGKITSTIKLSMTMASINSISVTTTLNTLANRVGASKKWLLLSGIFTATIKTSQAGYAYDTGVSSDSDGNFFSCNSNSDTLYWYSGIFTSTIKSYVSIAAKEGTVDDVSTNETDTLFCGDVHDKLFRISGKCSTTTVKDSKASPYINPYGIESDKIISIPDPPVLLSAVGGTEEVTLTWEDSDGATSYNIYWSTSPGVTKLDNKIEDVTSPYTHDTMIVFGIPYYYVVTAVGVGGESDVSNEESATPASANPNPPTGLYASGEYHQIRLTWTASIDDPENYLIYWSLTSGVTSETGQVIDTASDATEYVFESVHFVPHYFVVVAIKAGLPSEDSNEATATPISIVVKDNKLLQQYKDKININGLIDALWSDHINELKVVVMTLYTRLSIDGSSGKQLDNIGTIIGQERLGYDDTDYRMLLKARIGINNSKGTIEDIISIWKIMTQASFVRIQEVYPAQINILTDVDLPAETKALAMSLIQTVLGAGIKLGVVGVYDPTKFGFGENLGGFGSLWGTVF